MLPGVQRSGAGASPQLSALQVERDVLSSHLDSLQRQYVESQLQYQRLAVELEVSRAGRAALDQERESLAATIDLLQAKILKLDSESKGAQGDENVRLEMVASLQEQNRQLQQQRGALALELQTAREALAAAQHRAAQVAADAAETSASGGAATRLEAQLAAKARETRALVDQISAMSELIYEQVAQGQAAQQRLAQMSAELESVRQARASAAELQRQLAEARDGWRAAEERNTELQGRSVKAMAARAAAESKLAEVASLQGKLAAVQPGGEKELERVQAAGPGDVQLVSKEVEALRVQLDEREREVASLKAALLDRRAMAATIRQGKLHGIIPPAAAFVNTQRFWVPAPLLYDFVRCWLVREADMQAAGGFLGLQVVPEEDGVVTVSSHWAEVPQWEAWSTSTAARRHHLPSGIYQYVPKRGEGFPEDFVPFKDLSKPVDPKY